MHLKNVNYYLKTNIYLKTSGDQRHKSILKCSSFFQHQSSKDENSVGPKGELLYFFSPAIRGERKFLKET